jgi:hypothetical protein
VAVAVRLALASSFLFPSVESSPLPSVARNLTVGVATSEASARAWALALAFPFFLLSLDPPPLLSSRS